MAKQRTPEQEAIREAQRRPARKWFISWRMFWCNGPGTFGLFTTWNEVSMSWGEPPSKFHGEEMSEFAWTVGFRFWKPRLIIFKHRDRKIWLGDRQWKKDCGVL